MALVLKLHSNESALVHWSGTNSVADRDSVHGLNVWYQRRRSGAMLNLQLCTLFCTSARTRWPLTVGPVTKVVISCTSQRQPSLPQSCATELNCATKQSNIINCDRKSKDAASAKCHFAVCPLAKFHHSFRRWLIGSSQYRKVLLY